jgi:hypothetical protein
MVAMIHEEVHLTDEERAKASGTMRWAARVTLMAVLAGVAVVAVGHDERDAATAAAPGSSEPTGIIETLRAIERHNAVVQDVLSRPMLTTLQDQDALLRQLLGRQLDLSAEGNTYARRQLAATGHLEGLVGDSLGVQRSALEVAQRTLATTETAVARMDAIDAELERTVGQMEQIRRDVAEMNRKLPDLNLLRRLQEPAPEGPASTPQRRKPS